MLAGATHGRPRPVGDHGMHKSNLLRKTSGFRVGITGPRQRGNTTAPEPGVAQRGQGLRSLRRRGYRQRKEESKKKKNNKKNKKE